MNIYIYTVGLHISNLYTRRNQEIPRNLRQYCQFHSEFYNMICIYCVTNFYFQIPFLFSTMFLVLGQIK